MFQRINHKKILKNALRWIKLKYNIPKIMGAAKVVHRKKIML